MANSRIRRKLYAPHSLKGGLTLCGFAARITLRRSRKLPALFCCGGGEAAKPTTKRERKEVLQQQQQKKTFAVFVLLRRSRKGKISRMTKSQLRPTEIERDLWAAAKRDARRRWCRGRRRDCYGGFRGAAPLFPFRFATLPAFVAKLRADGLAAAVADASPHSPLL